MGNGKVQLRQPRLAEMVADVLRQRILDAELPDGASLPKQEDLLGEFDVSKPSIREALRILETEGLITVRRGNRGGAVVHAPRAQDVAYMLGLVLQSKAASLADVGLSLRHLEPACAAMCAEPEDREALVERLRTVHRAAVDSVEDGVEFVHHARRFHEEIVSSCGNETMKLVVGALESLWSAHEKAWALAAEEAGVFPEPEQRRRGLQAHERMLALIERGDAEGVQRVAYRHLGRSQLHALSAEGATRVQASSLRRTTT